MNWRNSESRSRQVTPPNTWNAPLTVIIHTGHVSDHVVDGDNHDETSVVIKITFQPLRHTPGYTLFVFGIGHKIFLPPKEPPRTNTDPSRRQYLVAPRPYLLEMTKRETVQVDRVLDKTWIWSHGRDPISCGDHNCDNIFTPDLTDSCLGGIDSYNHPYPKRVSGGGDTNDSNHSPLFLNFQSLKTGQNSDPSPESGPHWFPTEHPEGGECIRQYLLSFDNSVPRGLPPPLPAKRPLDHHGGPLRGRFYRTPRHQNPDRWPSDERQKRFRFLRHDLLCRLKEKEKDAFKGNSL